MPKDRTTQLAGRMRQLALEQGLESQSLRQALLTGSSRADIPAYQNHYVQKLTGLLRSNDTPCQSLALETLAADHLQDGDEAGSNPDAVRYKLNPQGCSRKKAIAVSSRESTS
jgi:hypothetical protein